MKKILLYSIILSFILIFIKYRYSDYDIKYEINDFKIITKYDNQRTYYEIKKDDRIYNFDIYKRRKLSKFKIENIKEIKDNDFYCIYPIIKDIQTYPLCYVNDIYTDYNLIDSELLDIYKTKNINVEKNTKDFTYYNNLSKDEYIALWNYNGYIVMNGKSYKNVEIFKNDKYDNTLSYMIKNKIYIADYNSEHEYKKLIVLDLKTLKKSEIELDKEIDFDSYIVGHVKKKLYIYDNKYSKLYEIDLKNGKTIIKGNNEIGFVKYNGKEFEVCSKAEYKVNKIKYNKEKSIYKYNLNEGLFKIISDNNNLSQKIHNENVTILKEEKNKLFYLNGDKFYMYDPLLSSRLVFYNYELSFNNNNTIFVYVDN